MPHPAERRRVEEDSSPVRSLQASPKMIASDQFFERFSFPPITFLSPWQRFPVESTRSKSDSSMGIDGSDP